MTLTDDLQKLEQLRLDGILSDEEFSKAKSLILTTPTSASRPDFGAVVENQLSQLRRLNELERIDREWDIERRQYEVVGRYGRRYIPSVGEGLVTVLISGILGSLWAIGAIAITSMMNSISVSLGYLDFSIPEYVLPAFGVVIALVAILRGLANCVVASNYQNAYRAYQLRHERADTDTTMNSHGQS